MLPPRVRPRNVAKRNVAKRYFGAPLIYGNRRSGHFRSTFKLHCDKEIRAVDIFVVPDFTASRAPAIEVDGVRVPSWLTGTYDLDYAAGGMFSVYYMRQDVLKILLAILGCCPNSLILLLRVHSAVAASRRRENQTRRRGSSSAAYSRHSTPSYEPSMMISSRSVVITANKP